jgi:hypothetical protein
MTTEQIIYNTAIKDGIPPRIAEYLVSQSKHETGNYSHRFFTVGKNAFGYSYNKNSKWQLDRGGPLADNGVAIAQYGSLENSVHEITDWIKRRQAEGKFPKDLNAIASPYEYAELLKKSGYYQADLATYGSRLTYFYNQVQSMALKYKKEIGWVVAAAALITIGIVVYTKRKVIFS